MFKVGDRVKVVDVIGQTDYFKSLFLNKVGEVVVIDATPWTISVKFTESTDGIQGMCFSEDELELINV